MAQATITRTFALLRTSVHGQLLVLAGGALLAAAALMAVPAAHVLVASQLLALLLVGVSARSAARGIAGYDTTPGDLPGDVLQLAPRLVAQAAGITVPAALTWWLALQLSGIAPAVGLVLVLLLVPASLLLPAPLLLSIAAVGCGDRSWLPAAAVTLARRRPGALVLHGLVLAGLVVAALCALPVVLVAFAVGAQLGPIAPVAFGIAAVAPAPLLGCGSVALWKSLDGDRLLHERIEAAAVEPNDGGSVPTSQAPPAPETPTAWADGPTWDIAIDAGAAWGTWIRLPAAVRIGLLVSWRGGAAPALSIASPDGSWRQPGDPSHPSTPVVVDMPPGDSYVQLTSRATSAQAVSVTLLLPATAAA